MQEIELDWTFDMLLNDCSYELANIKLAHSSTNSDLPMWFPIKKKASGTKHNVAPPTVMNGSLNPPTYKEQLKFKYNNLES